MRLPASHKHVLANHSDSRFSRSGAQRFQERKIYFMPSSILPRLVPTLSCTLSVITNTQTSVNKDL